jgi:hypothetical protein
MATKMCRCGHWLEDHVAEGHYEGREYLRECNECECISFHWSA